MCNTSDYITPIMCHLAENQALSDSSAMPQNDIFYFDRSFVMCIRIRIRQRSLSADIAFAFFHKSLSQGDRRRKRK